MRYGSKVRTKISPTIKYIILLLPLFKPDTISSIDNLHGLSVFMTGQKFFLLFCLLIWFFIGKRKIGLGSLAFPVFIISLSVSTYLNGNVSIMPHLYSTNADLVYYYFLASYTVEKKEYGELLRVAYIILGFWCIANTITVFAFYHRRYMYIANVSTAIVKDRYLLGSKNYQITFLLPLLGISFLYDLWKYNRIKKHTIFIHIFTLIPLFMTSAATSIIAVALFYLITVIIGKDKNSLRKLNASLVTITGNAAIFFAFVIMGSKGVIADLLEKIFNKSIKSQRSMIWRAYIEKIKMKPYLGYGYMSDWMQKKTTGIVHAHNQYLQLLFAGGLIGTCFFVIFLVSILRRAEKIKGKDGLIAFASLASMLIAYEGDYYYSMTFYFVAVIVLVKSFEMELG